MKKIMRLVNVQLWAAMREMLAIGNNQKRRSKSIYTGIILFFLLMSSISFFYSFMIGKGLQAFQSIQILPAMIMAVTSMIVLLTTTFKIKGIIFGFRDYDMIMSLPVKTSGIVASRLILLYGINLFFVVICILPMMVAYAIIVKPGILFYIISLITIWFIPLIPIILASILGTIITFASSKFRRSNLVHILISILAIVAIFGASFFMQNTGKELVNISRALTKQVNAIYPLADMYTKAVVDYDFTALLLFLGISVAAFLLYSIVIGRVFKKVNTIIMTGNTQGNYKMGELKTATPFQALYRKEIGRFFSSTVYVMNAGVGIVMLTLGTVALMFVDLEKAVGNAQAFDMLVKCSPIFILFCIGTSSTTMASISLEGRNLWVVKSLPVFPQQIFTAKLAVNLTLTAPAILDALLLGFILNLNVIQIILMLLITISSSILMSVFGLLVNLKFPNFNWTNETMVVKQSAATLIVIFSGMAIAGLQFLFLMIFKSFELTYLTFGLLLFVIDFILYKVLLNYGVKRFQTL